MPPDLHGGAGHGRPTRSNALTHFIRGIVEVGVEPVVILLGERIVPVIVALCAFESGSQPDRPGHVHAI